MEVFLIRFTGYNISQKDRKDRIVVPAKIKTPKVPEQLKLLERKGKYKKNS